MYVKRIKSDLYSLYEYECDFKLPFYARLENWDCAYVRVEDFINGVAVGSYFNHPTTYKNRKNDIIFKSKNICWYLISEDITKKLDDEFNKFL